MRYDAFPMSKNKRYDQFCPVCHALELVGERWALVIVRELLKGPKRYTDLLQGMPGVGTNILAARLRELEGAGIVHKRKLPPPAASTVYELTEYGRELEEPLYALARWGARSLEPPVKGEEFYADWGLNAFPALLDREASRGITGTYVARVDDETYTVRLGDCQVHVEAGATEGADLDFATDQETFFGLASGGLDPREALAGGSVQLLIGKPAGLERFFTLFNFAQRPLVSI